MGDSLITVNNYIELPNSGNSYGIGIGIIEGTNDLYIERFKRTFNENLTIKAFTCYGGAKDFNNLKIATTIRKYYLEKLQKGYKQNALLRQKLELLVFDMPLITGIKTKMIEL